MESQYKDKYILLQKDGSKINLTFQEGLIFTPGETGDIEDKNNSTLSNFFDSAANIKMVQANDTINVMDKFLTYYQLMYLEKLNYTPENKLKIIYSFKFDNTEFTLTRMKVDPDVEHKLNLAPMGNMEI
jgi:hypothetical protein